MLRENLLYDLQQRLRRHVCSFKFALRIADLDKLDMEASKFALAGNEIDSAMGHRVNCPNIR